MAAPAAVWLGLLVTVAACRSMRAPPAAALAIGPPRPGLPSAARSPPCRYFAEEWSTTVVVEPAGLRSRFEVAAREAVLEPTPRGGWIARVAAPLSFHGATEEPELRTARAVDWLTIAHAEPGRRVDSVRPADDGRALRGRVWLTSGGEPESSRDAFVESVPLGCADLRVAASDEEEAEGPRPVDIWRPVRMADLGFLRVRGSPQGPERVTVRGEGLFVHVLERRGDAALVVTEWSDGSRVRGWVDVASLREPDREETLSIGRAMGGLAELAIVGALPLAGWTPGTRLRWYGDAPFRSLVRRPTAPQPAPAVPVRVARGTAVYAYPGRGRWATVASDASFRAFARPSCEWVALEGVPGLELPPLRAWVRASTLRIE